MFEITKEITVDLPKILTNLYSNKNYMILDIETTGLSREFAEVILVGMIYALDDQWFITQIFCDHRSEEAQLLKKLMTYIKKEHMLITYNGHAFDIPFLNRRYEIHHIPFVISKEKHFDLYRVIRASKKALNLSNYKLKSVETFLGIEREDEISGKESVKLYEDYEISPTTSLRNKICLHNYEDILLMVPTLKILNHIPEDIIYRFYPIVVKTMYGNCFLMSYVESSDFINISAYMDKRLQTRVDYRLGFSFKSEGFLIDFRIPIFKIDHHKFIDIDLMPFYNHSFNDLSIDEQLLLKIDNQKNSYEKIIRCLNKYYFNEIN